MLENLKGLKTGDVVLFSGRCRVARLIQVLTLCKWSHIGMIIIDDDFDTPLVYESTHNDRVPGVYIKRKIKGVHAVKLTDRLEGYKGDIAIQRITGAELSDKDLEKFRVFRKASEGVLFENNIMEAFLSMFKWIRNKGCLLFRFCSEHLGASHVSLGFLPDDYPVHKLTPADYARRRVTLLKGELSELSVIKYYKI